MLEMYPDSRYADVMEQALYNTVLSGMALDGKSFFYVNPLEVLPEACHKDERKFHVKDIRQKWFGCACCPANVARLIASVDRYVYTERDGGRTVLAHQFIANQASFDSGLHVEQRSDFPWNGHIEYMLELPAEAAEFGTFRRAYSTWSADSYALTCDGVAVKTAPENGFVYFAVAPGTALHVVLDLDMAVRLVRATLMCVAMQVVLR